jgi:hypothetical protein
MVNKFLYTGRTKRLRNAHPTILNASTPGEIDRAFEAMVEQGVRALVVSGEYFFLSQRERLVALANRKTYRRSMPTRSSPKRAVS